MEIEGPAPDLEETQKIKKNQLNKIVIGGKATKHFKKERKKNGNSKDVKQGKQQFLNPLT